VDVDIHDQTKVIDVEKLQQDFVMNYKNQKQPVSLDFNPIMRTFNDVECDPNRRGAGQGGPGVGPPAMARTTCEIRINPSSFLWLVMGGVGRSSAVTVSELLATFCSL